jgi:hypothetical protein
MPFKLREWLHNISVNVSDEHYLVLRVLQRKRSKR